MKQCLMILSVASLALGNLPAWGGHALEVGSTYLGDGWFEYRLQAVQNPLASLFGLQDLSVPFRELVELGPPPADWAERLGGEDRVRWSWLGAGGTEPVPTPYAAVFRVRSELSSFRRARADVVWMFKPASVGVVYADVLVPCLPEAADNSPTNIVQYCLTWPEVRIETLVVTNHLPQGLVVTCTNSVQVEVQASSDLRQWGPVVTFNLIAPVHRWTSPVRLDAYGDYYRLRVIR
jgi:hypothetical protein